MAARQRKSGPGQSGGLTTGPEDEKKTKASGSNAFLIVALAVLFVGAGGFVFRKEIAAAVGKPSLQQAPVKGDPAVVHGKEKKDVSEADTPAEDKSREDKVVAEKPTVKANTDRLITMEELKAYDGSDDNKPVYLGLMGEVFDVSSGRQHYGKDGGYSFFAGRDGTRAFVTGEFNEEGLTDDVVGLSSPQILEVVNWVSFYHKDYKYVGKLIGTYFDENGQATEKYKAYQDMVEVANGERVSEEEMKKIFPPCNSHWAQGKGGTVWCSRERQDTFLLQLFFEMVCVVLSTYLIGFPSFSFSPAITHPFHRSVFY